jgi:YVTN family beta-propeller protein
MKKTIYTILIGVIFLCVLTKTNSVYAQTAYIANSGDNNVSVINTKTNFVTATIAVGSNPSSISVSPDGSKVYVANYSNFNTVSVINTATNLVTATIAVGMRPLTFGNFISTFKNVGIPLLINESANVSIYPNPNNGNFTIQLKNTADKNGTITIVDMLGRIVYETPYKLNGNDDTISISEMHLKVGTYNIIIGRKDGVTTRKSFVVVEG